MKKHILIISQYFFPEQFRINDICCEWIKRGYKVTVLTGIPNYPEGRFYQGYGLFKQGKDNWNGIDIVRIPIVPRGHSSIQLVLNYYSFVISGWFWKCFTKLKPDLIFTFGLSPMTQALIGAWFSKRRKIPNYLYVQDLWPESLEIAGGVHNKSILDHYQKMADRIYKSCTKIFATSPSFVKDIQNRVTDKEKVIYWPQYAEDFYMPIKKTTIPEIPDDGRFKIVFTGNIGNAQGLDILPKVAKQADTDICFVIVGDGRYKNELIKEIDDEKVAAKFIIIPRQPAERIPEILAACDMAFLSFQDNELWSKTIPAKLQSYMACGMPILAVANGETKRIIEEAKCGCCYQFSEIEELLRKVYFLMKHDDILEKYSANSRRYYEDYYSKEVLMNSIDGELLLEE